MKYVGLITAIALIFAFALPAYAETQSVKVSGDLTIHAIARDNFDLDKNNDTGNDYPAGIGAPTGMSGENFIISIAEIQVDADLTDNVSTCVRIVNQRNWGDSDYKTLSDDGQQFMSTGHDLLDLGVDLAYVQIKELIFEPITLKLGRQDLWFGRGLIIGANLVDPGLIEANLAGDAVGRLRGIGSPELTAYRSFDAARLTLDMEKYAPLVVDLVYFRNDQGSLSSDSVDVLGVNAGYTWNVYNAETEAYYWYKQNNQDGNPLTAEENEIHTIGLRGSFNPAEDWLFGGEAAFQFGRRIATVPVGTDQGNSMLQPQERRAGMFDLFVDYLGWQKYMYSPKIGVEAIYTSGDDVEPGDLGDTYTQWDTMYRGYFPTMIRPWLGRYYFTSRYPNGEDFYGSNQWELLLKGSLKPLDDVSLDATIAKYYLQDIPIRMGEGADQGYIHDYDLGTEFNIVAKYDYTEDVTFSLASAWFWPGDVYDEQSDQNTIPDTPTDLQPTMATQVIGSVKVSF